MNSDETLVGDIFLRSVGREPKYNTDVFGIEVEVEGYSLPEPSVFWATHNDGSLKKDFEPCDDPECEECNSIGPNSLNALEYVLRSPLTKTETQAASNYLNNLFTKNKTRINDSIRTAIHIHMNVTHWPYIEFMNFLTAYYFIEDSLLSLCGLGRMNNQFCLPASSCWGSVKVIKDLNERLLGSKDVYTIFCEDQHKYAALNLSSIPRLGTVEFRAIMTPNSPEGIEKEINFWIDLLSTLRHNTSKFQSPEHICNLFSCYGYKEFYTKILGESIYNNYIEPLVPDHKALLIRNVRNAQIIAYFKWDDLKKTLQDFKPNPVDSQKKVPSLGWITGYDSHTQPTFNPEELFSILESSSNE
jgi:hypothetical protein